MKLSAWAAVAALIMIGAPVANATVMGSAATSVAQSPAAKSSPVETIGWKKHHRHKKCWRHHGHLKCRWM
jgi:hypothetical protein